MLRYFARRFTYFVLQFLTFSNCLPYNPPMKSKSLASKPKPEKASGTESVTIRVEREHLTRIDLVARTMGLKRSGAIKVAIAEFIERRAKGLEESSARAGREL